MPDDPPCWRCVDHVPPGYYCPICGRTNDDPPPEHLTESEPTTRCSQGIE